MFCVCECLLEICRVQKVLENTVVYIALTATDCAKTILLLRHQANFLAIRPACVLCRDCACRTADCLPVVSLAAQNGRIFASLHLSCLAAHLPVVLPHPPRHRQTGGTVAGRLRASEERTAREGGAARGRVKCRTEGRADHGA